MANASGFAEHSPSFKSATQAPETAAQERVRFRPDFSTHYGRLRARYVAGGVDHLSDYDLLELLLLNEQAGPTLQPMLIRLFRVFGDLAGIARASPRDLRLYGRVDEESIARLKLAEVICNKLRRADPLNGPNLTSSELILSYCWRKIAPQADDQLHMLYLNRKNMLIRHEAQNIELAEDLETPNRAILRRSLELNATALILVQCRVGGAVKPSEIEMKFVTKLQYSAAILGITMHDCLHLGTENEISFREHGYL